MEFSVELIKSPQRDHRALFGLASGGIAIRLHELDVVIGAAAGEFDEYATTLSHEIPVKTAEKCLIAPLHK